MTCRCGLTIRPDRDLAAHPRRAFAYANCIYRCDCGAGYSNAASPAHRTLVWSSPERNVPEEVAAGVIDVLRRAVNVANRAAKIQKFCSERSEDAVTWTVVRALGATGRLGALGDESPAAETPAVLLWGVPVCGPSAESLAAELADVCAEIGEGASYRSEPDIIVVWAGHIVFAEAKYTSQNDVKPNYKGFGRYLDRPELFAAGAAAVRAAGFYELTRNWRIGVDLAERLGRRFMLVNLGPAGIEGSAQRFAALLATDAERAFRHFSWAQLLERAEMDGPLPGWCRRYAAERGLQRGPAVS
jgi:hypothetical protein